MKLALSLLVLVVSLQSQAQEKQTIWNCLGTCVTGPLAETPVISMSCSSEEKALQSLENLCSDPTNPQGEVEVKDIECAEMGSRNRG